MRRTTAISFLASSGLAALALAAEPAPPVELNVGVDEPFHVEGVDHLRERIVLTAVDGRRKKRARVLALTADGVTCRAPRLPAGTYELWIGRRTGRRLVGIVEIEPPRVEDLRPLDDGQVEVRGTGFGLRRGRLRIGGRRAKVSAWDADRIVAQLPGQLDRAADVELKGKAGRAEAPCAVLTLGSERVVGAPGAGVAPSWTFDWTPRSGGSVYQSQYWNRTSVSYAPVDDRFSMELNVDPEQPVGGYYFVLTEGAKPQNTPDEYAAVFVDLATGSPVVNVFAYNGGRLGDNWYDGWFAHGQPAPDRVVSSIVEPGVVLAHHNRTEPDGTRTIGITLDGARINAHVPALHRQDASTWKGLSYGNRVGLWVYLTDDTESTYEDGWITHYDTGVFRYTPSIDGSDYVTTWNDGTLATEIVTTETGDLPVLRVNDDHVPPVGTSGNDVFRAGAGGDKFSTGAGNDLVLVDDSTGSPTIDFGSGGRDVLEWKADPVTWIDGRPPTGTRIAETVTLWLDVPPGEGTSGVEPQWNEEGELVLPSDSSGRINLPDGRVISFTGLELLRF